MASEAVNPWDKKCPQCGELAQTFEMFCCSGYCGARFVTPRFRPIEAAPEITKAMVERAAKAICYEWGYLWDAPADDPQSTGDGTIGDERPTKTQYRDAARAALEAHGEGE